MGILTPIGYKKETFSEGELEKIGEILHGDEHSAVENYEDEFWKK